MVTHTTPEIIETFVDLYKKGVLVSDIAKQTGFSEFTIHKHIKRAGLSRYDDRKPHTLDDHRFDVLDADAFYWLGFLVTDGCVFNGRRIKFGLGKVDAQTVDMFKRFVKYDGAVEFDKKTKSPSIRFTSHHMAHTLRAHGMVERKSAIVKTSAECAASVYFWRGAFEGDGGICESKTGLITFTSASIVFAQQYCDFLNFNIKQLQAHPTVRAGTQLWDVRISGDAAKLVLDLLYRGAITWGLPRKEAAKLVLDMKEIKSPLHSNFFKRTQAGTVVISKDEVYEYLNLDRDKWHARSLQFADRVINTPPPYRTCTYEQACADFSRLSNMNTNLLWDVNADWPMKYSQGEYHKLGLLYKHICGQSSADVWQCQERWRARYIYDPSPWFRWHDLHYMAGVIRNRIATGVREFTMAHMRHAVLQNGYTPAQFPPSAAKAIIERFQAKVVLDPFAGWGDRLVGFLASSADHYFGVDNNQALHTGYKNAMMYNKLKKCTLICADSKDPNVWASAPQADLILTSPPYAYLEQYRFAKTPPVQADVWTRDFLIPIISSCCSKLSSGGHVVIHMNNIKIRRDILYLVDELIKQMQGLVFVGCYGLYGKTRKFLHAEPLMVWSKNA